MHGTAKIFTFNLLLCGLVKDTFRYWNPPFCSKTASLIAERLLASIASSACSYLAAGGNFSEMPTLSASRMSAICWTRQPMPIC